MTVVDGVGRDDSDQESNQKNVKLWSVHCSSLGGGGEGKVGEEGQRERKKKANRPNWDIGERNNATNIWWDPPLAIPGKTFMTVLLWGPAAGPCTEFIERPGDFGVPAACPIASIYELTFNFSKVCSKRPFLTESRFGKLLVFLQRQLWDSMGDWIVLGFGPVRQI